MTNDLLCVDCAPWREAMGAELDGEHPGIDPGLLEAHLRRCPECTAFREFSHGLRRADLRPAELRPDVAPAVVKTAQILDGVRSWTLARAVLAVCAIDILVFAASDLIGPADEASHSARHLGAFSAAFGVALIVVVVRPARARAMLPVGVVLGLALVISAIVDLLRGEVPLVNEVQHLPEVLSVLMLWLLAASSRRHRATSDPARPPVLAPRLRSVDRRSETA